jgi:hypothetical protein
VWSDVDLFHGVGVDVEEPTFRQPISDKIKHQEEEEDEHNEVMSTYCADIPDPNPPLNMCAPSTGDDEEQSIVLK